MTDYKLSATLTLMKKLILQLMIFPVFSLLAACGEGTDGKQVRAVDVTKMLSPEYSGRYVSENNEEISMTILGTKKFLHHQMQLKAEAIISFRPPVNDLVEVKISTPGIDSDNARVGFINLSQYQSLQSPARVDLEIDCVYRQEGEIKNLYYLPAIDQRKNTYGYVEKSQADEFPTARYFLHTDLNEFKVESSTAQSPNQAKVLAELVQFLGSSSDWSNQVRYRCDLVRPESLRNAYTGVILPLEKIEINQLKVAATHQSRNRSAKTGYELDRDKIFSKK